MGILIILLDAVLAGFLVLLGQNIKETRKIKLEADPGFATAIPTIYNSFLVAIFLGILFFLAKQIF
jgi:hypothetical protein